MSTSTSLFCKQKKYIELVEVFEGIIPYIYIYIHTCVYKQTHAKFISIIKICSSDVSILYENGGLWLTKGLTKMHSLDPTVIEKYKIESGIHFNWVRKDVHWMNLARNDILYGACVLVGLSLQVLLADS
jgi:hypothetical protein